MHKQNLACSPFEDRNWIFRDPLKSLATLSRTAMWTYHAQAERLNLAYVWWSVFYCHLININWKCWNNYTDLKHFHRIVLRDCDCAYRSVWPGSPFSGFINRSLSCSIANRYVPYSYRSPLAFRQHFFCFRTWLHVVCRHQTTIQRKNESVSY